MSKNSNTIVRRKIVFLCGDGANEQSMAIIRNTLEKCARAIIIAPYLETIQTENRKDLKVDQSYLITASVLFDWIFIPDGKHNTKLAIMGEVKEFINTLLNIVNLLLTMKLPRTFIIKLTLSQILMKVLYSTKVI